MFSFRIRLQTMLTNATLILTTNFLHLSRNRLSRITFDLSCWTQYISSLRQRCLSFIQHRVRHLQTCIIHLRIWTVINVLINDRRRCIIYTNFVLCLLYFLCLFSHLSIRHQVPSHHECFTYRVDSLNELNRLVFWQILRATLTTRAYSLVFLRLYVLFCLLTGLLLLLQSWFLKLEQV